MVGNPKALQRLVDGGKLRLNSISCVVVDEVDACLIASTTRRELHRLLSRHLSKSFQVMEDGMSFSRASFCPQATSKITLPRVNILPPLPLSQCYFHPLQVLGILIPLDILLVQDESNGTWDLLWVASLQVGSYHCGRAVCIGPCRRPGAGSVRHVRG